MRKRASFKGFTIVELLIVIVVIGILATIVLVAYNGIRTQAEDASLQSEASQAGKKVLAYKTLNSETLPADTATAGVSAGTGHDLYYRVTPDGRGFCLAVSLSTDPTRAYSVTSTNGAVKRGTCQGYILVPGNATLGTSDFWVMKYEAKNVSGVAMSQATGNPWVSISQTSAISTSQAACDGCHLISEPEWMTLAGNVLGVASNWSTGVVGSGYIYSGHNDNVPANSLAASATDSDGYNGTGNASGNQRRTLTLSNGEVVWDLAGNVLEWTSGTIASGQQPGFVGEGTFSLKEWNNPSLIMNGLPPTSRPSGISGAVAGYSSAQGIGALYSNYGAAATYGYFRGGGWSNGVNAGVLYLDLNGLPNGQGAPLGFRISR